MGLLGSFLGFHLKPRAAAEAEANDVLPSRERQILDWVDQGMPVPPPHVVKQAVVLAYAQRCGITTLVETGTYFGAMVEAMHEHFEQIFSIELSEALFARAQARFHGMPGITLLQGDSAREIANVLPQLTAPALFWLDGHWSDGVTARGDTNTPVREELAAILAAPDLPHIVLIDDAREFGVDPSYPTIEELRQLVSAQRPQWRLSVDADIIRIHPAMI